jgi:antitoxin (DNA-binding transcriptional repressor) of toxin-antitoxin stability system
VAQGEQIIVTEADQAMAELLPASRRPLTADILHARWHGLPAADCRVMQVELDEILNPAL